MNLYPPCQTIHDSADKIMWIPGIFTVGGHGTPWYMEDDSSKYISATDLARMIINHPDYSPGMPVMLLSCKTGGNAGDGYSSFAKKVSTELGAIVYGADNYIWIYSDGSFYIADESPQCICTSDPQPEPDLKKPG